MKGRRGRAPPDFSLASIKGGPLGIHRSIYFQAQPAAGTFWLGRSGFCLPPNESQNASGLSMIAERSPRLIFALIEAGALFAAVCYIFKSL